MNESSSLSAATSLTGRICISRQPVQHCNGVPILVFTSLPDFEPDHDTMNIAKAMDEASNSSSIYHLHLGDFQAAKVKPFTQCELNDLVRDLALSKEASEILGSHLSEHCVRESEVKITFCSNRDKECVRYFAITSKAF